MEAWSLHGGGLTLISNGVGLKCSIISNRPCFGVFYY